MEGKGYQTHTPKPHVWLCLPVTGFGTGEKGNKDGRSRGEGGNVKGGEHVSAFVRLPQMLVITIRFNERKEEFASFIIFLSVHHFLHVHFCFFSLTPPLFF